MQHREPSGDQISDQEYLERFINRRLNREREDYDCENGDMDCALWEHGPCAGDVLVRVDIVRKAQARKQPAPTLEKC